MDFVISDGILVKYSGCSKVIAVPEGVTTIAAGAFDPSRQIEKIQFPESLLCIEEKAFYGLLISSSTHCCIIKFPLQSICWITAIDSPNGPFPHYGMFLPPRTGR